MHATLAVYMSGHQSAIMNQTKSAFTVIVYLDCMF